jgi:polysaccharide export outer membrane protein
MNRKIVLYSTWGLLFLASCSASQKNVEFFKNMEEETQYYVEHNAEPPIQKEDRLIITVDSKFPELAFPFKMPGATVQITPDGNISTNQNSLSGNTGSSGGVKGYKVGLNGNIDFPVLGVLHVEGLTLTQLKKLIHDKIVDGHYISDPIVATGFANFKIITFGELNAKGMVNADDDKITILELLAKAGGISPNGRPDRVIVIRDINGRKQFFPNDVRSTELFKSPTYYLQQNDMVYVEPIIEKKKRNMGENILRYLSVGLSLIATVFAIRNLFPAK